MCQLILISDIINVPANNKFSHNVPANKKYRHYVPAKNKYRHNVIIIK